MSLIEQTSDKIASYLTNQLEKDNDYQEVLAYGTFALIQTIWAILVTIIFGFLLDILVQTLIISFAGAILRKNSGGAHASSPNRCAIIGAIIACGQAYIYKLVPYFHRDIWLAFIIASFLFSFYIIYQYAPVDTPNKPIKNTETRKRLRKNSLITLFVFLVITLTLIIFYLGIKNENLLVSAILVSVGALWQSVTLLPLGHFIIEGMDTLLGKIIKR